MEMGDFSFEKYEKLRDWSKVYDAPVPVGSGAQGQVYRLREKESGQYYALKVYEKEQYQKREAEFLARADHPLFPVFYEAGSEDGLYFIRMEYIWGERLDRILSRRGGFSQPEAMKLAITVADGLAWLQEQDGSILFRDLKAENLILQPDGEIKLVDFGSACRITEADETITGTPGYAPKEQLGEGKVGTYSDVYAFGRLFDFMLTGENPVQGKGERTPLQQYDKRLSQSLELLLRDCNQIEGNRRIPHMYGVLQKMVEIASCSPAAYRKMEKASERQLAQYRSEVIFEKDIH